MRRRVAGMDQIDDALLEFYDHISPDDDPVWMKPGNVYRNLVVEREIVDKGHATVVRHIQKLADAGLLQTADDDSGFYAITDLGRRYLDDELTENERKQLETTLG